MVSDVVAVHQFFDKHEPIPLRTDMRAIGLERHGELIAGVLYDSFNGHNICMHVAAKPGVLWLRPLFLQTIFTYPFVQCGVSRITGLVRETNLAARKLDEHVGFTEETRLKGAAEDGSDLIVYVMWRDKCRYIAH